MNIGVHFPLREGFKKKSKNVMEISIWGGGVMTIPSLNYFFFVRVLNDAKMH